MRRVAREAFERQSLERIIRQALNESKAKGRDHITQTELPVRAGCRSRSDLSASEVLAAVWMLQQS